MDCVDKLQEISLRLDHIEAAGEWLARALVHSDNPASQTGSLILALAEDIRERMLELVTELQKEIIVSNRNH